MDYQDFYYVDNSRNATPVVRDHRPGVPVGLPTRTIVTSPASSYPTVATVPNVMPWPSQGWPSSQGWPGYPVQSSQGWPGYPVQPGYVMPPVPASSNLASILGGFGDIGSLANIIAQAFAAFMPLPAAPTPQDSPNSSDSGEHVVNAAVNSSNLIRYQSALAQFARRDQQILTLGSVLKELFKRPGMVTG